MSEARCRTCAHTGRCNPHAGRGQGRDCERSRLSTRRVLQALLPACWFALAAAFFLATAL